MTIRVNITNTSPWDDVRSTYIVLRTLSGISGDMLLTGLAKLSDLDGRGLDGIISKIGIPELNGSLRIQETSVDKISGWRSEIILKKVHEHRTFADIRKIIASSGLTVRAKDVAESAFTRLAGAEAEVHGVDRDEVVFHEIGGLDGILDICLCAALYDLISPFKFICSPLPLCDGVIRCGHGVLASPAPATLRLLEGVPVYGIESEGETVTPTAVALLKAFGTEFGKWPAVTIRKTVHVYGGRVLPRVPNGAIFALGDGEI